MLEYLFANKNVEKILMYIFLHEKAYASELSRTFDSPLYPIQKTLAKLEEGGLLVSFLEGKTRVFKWNPRCPFLPEMQALARKAYNFLPVKIQETQYKSIRRTRPRRTGKPL